MIRFTVACTNECTTLTPTYAHKPYFVYLLWSPIFPS